MLSVDKVQSDRSSVKSIVENASEMIIHSRTESSLLEEQISEDYNWKNKSLYSYENYEDCNPLKDDGWFQEEALKMRIDDALWNTNPIPNYYDDDGVDKFFDLVRIMNLRPISKMRHMLRSEEINLRFYGIDPRIVKCICDALKMNKSVKTLNLEGNFLTIDACYHLNDLLLHNSTIIRLNLSGCKIGPRAIKLLNNGIILNSKILTLNLSNCNICDEGFHIFSQAVQENCSLKTLNLSNNKLTDECGKDLYSMIIYNYSIQKLDLSWNNLSSENFCKDIFNALCSNEFIKEVDLSWNGLSSELTDGAIKQICLFLSKNLSLEVLSLKYNRFNENDAEKIGYALMKNTKLKKIDLGGNPIKFEGALNLIKILNSIPESGLEELDLSQIWISEAKRPSMINIEKNIIKKVDFEAIIQNYNKRFSPSSLINDILNTIPRINTEQKYDLEEVYKSKSVKVKLTKKPILKAKKTKKK